MPLQPITHLQTPRLAIVPVAVDHLPDLLEINRDEEVTFHVPYKTWASAEDAQAWFARMKTLCEGGTSQQLVLQRRSDGKIIGTFLVFKYDEGSARAEIGYVLGRPYWGQGYMQEALAAFVDHAFNGMGLRRLEAEVNPENAASCKLLERAGFRKEGTLRMRWAAKGKTYDVNAYGLLADDPR